MVTPIQKLNMVRTDNEIYMKREDLLPCSFGGNKVRIAESFLADLEKKGCDCMVGYGNARSNLCRVLSALCAGRGIPCYIVSPADDDGDRTETANSRLSRLCGAQYVCCTKQNVAETVERTLEHCRALGLRPYYIYGSKFGTGNESAAAEAYRRVYGEIRDQAEQMGLEFDYIFLATGTGMTQSGLLAGKHAAGGREHIVGISVAREEAAARKALQKYVRAVEPESPCFSDIEVDDSSISGGYGRYGYPIVRTIEERMCRDGIALDPTYSGKAFRGMENYLHSHRLTGKKILFLHTGGTPLYFDMLNSGITAESLIRKLPDDAQTVRMVREFLLRWGGEFSVPIYEKVELDTYVPKLLSRGYVIGAVDSVGELQGLFGGYANDRETLTAYGSCFVVSPALRGSGAAEAIFDRQLEYCREQGMRRQIFSTDLGNLGARRFYEKLQIPEDPSRTTEDAVAYRIEL